MNLVDANVLVYATDEGAEHHVAARDWLDAAMSGQATVLLPWVSLLAFARLTTNPRVYARPMSTDAVFGVIGQWLDRPNVRTPEPDGRHLQRMASLLGASGGRGGNLVNDAHLAALAMQWNATVITFDHDFARFRDVRRFRPS